MQSFIQTIKKILAFILDILSAPFYVAGLLSLIFLVFLDTLKLKLVGYSTDKKIQQMTKEEDIND